MKIYVASSWRNELQGGVVEMARMLGHEVYDFKNPPHGGGGFSWADIDPEWEKWTTEQYKAALSTDIAVKGYWSDKRGMEWAELGILVLPCGRSAHTEAGWMQGMGMPVYVFSPGKHEPELMYKVFEGIIGTWAELSVQMIKWEKQ
jgi:hypothetical protein